MLILIETLEDLEASEVDTVASEEATEEAMEDTEVDLEAMAVKEVMDGADKTKNNSTGPRTTNF
jgi:hypothetical protein